MFIAIVNQKGGTGKTTTAISLGSALAKAGKSVLLIDMDPQGNLSYSLGVHEFDHSLGEVLMGEASVQETVVHLEEEGLDIIPSSIDLANVEITMAGIDERETVLKAALVGIESYDYVLIDCPPSFSLLTLNALTFAQYVIIPMQMTVLSLQGLELILDTIQQIKEGLNPELKVLGVLPVMMDKRRKLSQEVLEHIDENYEVNIFETNIRTNVRAAEAPSFGQSVIRYAPKSNSALDYLAFSEELMSSHS